MASLQDLLQKTLLFTAARDAGVDAFNTLRHAPGDPIAFGPPAPAAGGDPGDQAVWHWVHDPANPAKFTAVDAFVRSAGMRMPVCTQIEVEKVMVTTEADLPPFDLPLTSKYVLAKFHLPAAEMTAHSHGWWQLPAKLDHSLLVVFGYELVQASGADPKPLDFDTIDKLGGRFFPNPDVPADDPDAPEAPPGSDPADAGLPPATAKVNESVTVFVAPTWMIVAVSLTTCKERADFEPGELLGAGRLYPHVMVTANHDVTQVECKILVTRPPKTMPHDTEMELDIGGIMIADTNEDQRIAAYPPGPLPLWSNFFDYFDLDPPIGREFCFVDPKRIGERIEFGLVKREKTLHLPSDYDKGSRIVKKPRQGEFDNLHVAPKMRFSNPQSGVNISHIAMAPFCIHDCLHTHTRWGLPGGDSKAFNRGFDGRKPYAVGGAPLVPANQTVFLTRTTPSSFRYRAVAAGPILPGMFSVFYHHGSGYALAVASPTFFGLARFGVQQYVELCVNPFVELIVEDPGGGMPVVTRVTMDVNGMSSVAAFYQRLRFMGKTKPDTWLERLEVLDLPKCRSA